MRIRTVFSRSPKLPESLQHRSPAHRYQHRNLRPDPYKPSSAKVYLPKYTTYLRDTLGSLEVTLLPLVIERDGMILIYFDLPQPENLTLNHSSGLETLTEVEDHTTIGQYLAIDATSPILSPDRNFFQYTRTGPWD